MKRMDDFIDQFLGLFSTHHSHVGSDGVWKSLFASVTLGVTSLVIEIIPLLDGAMGIGTRFFQLIIAGCGAFIIIHKAIQLYKQHYSKPKP